VSAPDDTTHAIFDEGDLRKYRTEIPNMVYDIGLTPYEGWLYGHFKRVCGAKPEGMCWKSVATLAKETGMSTGRVSEARRELERRGLIKMDEAFLFEPLSQPACYRPLPFTPLHRCESPQVLVSALRPSAAVILQTAAPRSP
jgi:hypothetical protein